MQFIPEPVPGQPSPDEARARQDELGQAEIAYRGLRRLVREGELQPGEVFSEGAVAATLSVGRTPFREAVSRLAHEGLVLRLPKRGVLVKSLGVEDVKDLYEVRRSLEILCVRRAVAHISPQDLIHLRQLLEEADRLVEAGISWRDYREHDLRFHNFIWTASGNKRACELLQSTHDAVILDPLFERFADMPGQQRRSIEEHRQIIDAIDTGDADASAAAIAEHGESYMRALVTRLFGTYDNRS